MNEPKDVPPGLPPLSACDGSAAGAPTAEPASQGLPRPKPAVIPQVPTPDGGEVPADHRNALFREINHRVKNSLQFVSSLLFMHSRAIQDPADREHFLEAASQIATVAQVHERLARTAEASTIAFGTFLRLVCDDLARLRCEGRPAPTLVTETLEVDLPPDTAVPLALIANELITNALKYAFPGGRTGHIRIGLARDAGDRLRLTIADDGIGLPADFDVPANFDAKRSRGLGLALVRALVEQIGGRIVIERCRPGTLFIVELPVPRPTSGDDLNVDRPG